MSNLVINPKSSIWGIFVGYNGDQLKTFNSTHLFPPEEGKTGHLAIGWGALGTLNLYRENYQAYEKAYEIAYPYPESKDQSRQAYSIRKNMAWRFAFEMQIGDYVIAPSSINDLVIIGEINGEYDGGNFHNELELIPERWVVDPLLIHTRPVRWLKVIHRGDEHYSSINRIGQLTLSKLTMTHTELALVLESTK
jgi:hypothetical protein